MQVTQSSDWPGTFTELYEARQSIFLSTDKVGAVYLTRMLLLYFVELVEILVYSAQGQLIRNEFFQPIFTNLLKQEQL
jgi:hypothetical protein